MEYMHDRNAGTVAASRHRAIDSSSATARDCVSRSESLVRHAKTLCFKLCGDGDDIVATVTVPANDLLIFRWWSRWNFR